MMHYPKYQVTNEQSPLKGLRHAQPVSINLISVICVLLLSALNNQSINLNFYGRLHITQRNPAPLHISLRTKQIFISLPMVNHHIRHIMLVVHIVHTNQPAPFLFDGTLIIRSKEIIIEHHYLITAEPGKEIIEMRLLP